MGAPLKYLDVGGGLGVDYDGSQTNFSSSMNYTMQEYANDIVFTLQEICDAASVPTRPSSPSRGARSSPTTPCWSSTCWASASSTSARPPTRSPKDASRVVRTCSRPFRDVSRKNLLEAYHDALEYKEEPAALQPRATCRCRERVVAEDIFWAVCQKILRSCATCARSPKSWKAWSGRCRDTYFCNFSMFQSLPDIWAIDQLFPIMPIHRLGEEPTRRAVLADITCDSDGKIDQFIDRRDVKHVLELHPLNGDDYYLGIFLVGAYQEILGDLHNLFGDTNTVHVSLAAGGGYHIEHVVTGDTVTDVLKYVSYQREDLTARVRRFAELALRASRMTLEETRSLLRIYEQGLSGYTYLERA